MKKSQLIAIVFPILIVLVTVFVIISNQKKVEIVKSLNIENSKEIIKKIKIEDERFQDEKAIIIKNPDSYGNISDLIEKEEFKNNVLYIDIWSLTCAPCLREFQQSIELKERYSDSSVKFI